MSVLQHDERRDHLAARLVRPADDAALGHGRVREERALHFDRADAVRGDLDDLVGAAAEPEVAVLVDVGRVAGVVDARDLAPSSRGSYRSGSPQSAGVRPGNGRVSTMMPFSFGRARLARPSSRRRLDAGQRDARPTRA